MISTRLRRAADAALIAASMLALAACATAPAAPKPAAPPPAAAKPTRGYGEMKPIPNPEADKPAPAAPPPRSASPQAPRSAPKPAAPAAPRADAGRAAQLRAQGLEQLNRGAVDRAIALLRQAKALDPNNALIQRDLDRAVRIGAAVKGK